MKLINNEFIKKTLNIINGSATELDCEVQYGSNLAHLQTTGSLPLIQTGISTPLRCTITVLFIVTCSGLPQTMFTLICLVMYY